jgi:hypothetical protein
MNNFHESDDGDRLDKAIRRVRDQLRDDSPEIDYGQILGFVGGCLEQEESRLVEHRILHWRSWHDAYLEMQGYMALASVSRGQGGDFAPSDVGVRATVREKPTKLRYQTRRVAIALMLTAASILIAASVFFWRPWSHGSDIFAIRDGGELVVLDKDGNLRGLDSYGADRRNEAQLLLQEKRFEVSTEIARLTQDIREAGLRSNSNPYAAFVSPVNTVVDTDQPTLKWNEPSVGTSTYQVNLYDSAGKELYSQEVSETTWTVPKALERGMTYSWEIISIKNGERRLAPQRGTPRPKFKILDEASWQLIRAEAANLEGSHILLSLLYAEAGLLDKAEQEVEILAAENAHSKIVGALRQSIQRLRRGSS